MDDLAISVVIPVKNGQRYLNSALQRVFSQKINERFEVIIVDSGSTDKTLDIIRRYPARLYCIPEKEFNHGLTRNLGISKACGKYIVLMTQDAIPCDNFWMKNLVDNLKRDQSIAGVYSMQIPRPDAHILTQIRVNRFFAAAKTRRESRIYEIEEYNKLSWDEKHRLCNFDNVSSCIRKDIWKKIPLPKADFGEDIEWSKNVLEKGYKIVYEPNSKVYHSHDFSIFDWHKRNLINFKRLSALFGAKTRNNLCRLLADFFIYVFKDAWLLLCEGKKGFKALFFNIHLIPLYSFFGLLGRYKWIKEALVSNENSPSSP